MLLLLIGIFCNLNIIYSIDNQSICDMTISTNYSNNPEDNDYKSCNNSRDEWPIDSTVNHNKTQSNKIISCINTCKQNMKIYKIYKDINSQKLCDNDNKDNYEQQEILNILYKKCYYNNIFESKEVILNIINDGNFGISITKKKILKIQNKIEQLEKFIDALDKYLNELLNN